MKHPAKKQRYDYTLLVVVLLLVGIGLILLYSTSAYNGRVKFHDSFYYLKKQGFATALGLAGMFIVAGIDYHRWIPFAKLGYVTAIVLSVAVMFIGDEYNGSKRWLSLGPISFQPSEFAKVAVILYLSCVISNQARKMEKFTTLVKVMLPVLPVVGLVGASNLSTAIIILGIAAALVFVASPKYAQFLGMGAAAAGLWGYFWHWKVIVWRDLQSGEIRKSMKKGTRHCRDFMPSVPEGCLEEGLEKAYRSWDFCRKPRMI